MKASHLPFSAEARRAGVFWAIAAIPFAIALGAGATKLEAVVQLFFGSEWFSFKAVVGASEILVFGLVAGITEQRIASKRGGGKGDAV